MASTGCLESPQIFRNCGRRLTLFIYFQYVVVNIRFQLYYDDIFIPSCQIAIAVVTLTVLLEVHTVVPFRQIKYINLKMNW